MVTSPMVSMYKDKYNLKWVVDSLLTIEECRILYRAANEMFGPSDWTNIIPTMNTKQEEDNRFTFTGQFTFHGLSPDSEYEVIIQTRNKEGWADPSNIFKFSTRMEGKLTFSSLAHGWKVSLHFQVQHTDGR